MNAKDIVATMETLLKELNELEDKLYNKYGVRYRWSYIEGGPSFECKEGSEKYLYHSYCDGDFICEIEQLRCELNGILEHKLYIGKLIKDLNKEAA